MNSVRPLDSTEPNANVATTQRTTHNNCATDDIDSDPPTDPELWGTETRRAARIEPQKSGSEFQKFKIGLGVAVLVCLGVVALKLSSAKGGSREISASPEDHCTLNPEGCSFREWCESGEESFICHPCPTYHVPSHDGVGCMLECPQDRIPSEDGETCILECPPDYVNTPDGQSCVADVCGSSASFKTQHKVNGFEGYLPTPPAKWDRFGSAVAAMGDFNGDKLLDIAVGANHFDDEARFTLNSGAVYILLLDFDHHTVIDQIRVRGRGEQSHLERFSYFGTSLACPGDLDGDGVPDLIVGAPEGNEDRDGSTEKGGELYGIGALYVLWLERSGDVKQEQIIRATDTGFKSGTRGWGWRLGVVGDLDKDDVVDVVVGTLTTAYLLQLNVDGTVKTGKQLKVNAQIPNWAKPVMGGVSGVGDVNGDGVVDIAVGGPQLDGGMGSVSVLFMREDGSVLKTTLISSTQGGLVGPLRAGEQFGVSITGLGDLDGDGTPDLAVGAMDTAPSGIGGSSKNDRGGSVYILRMTPGGEVKYEQIIGGGDNKGGLTAGSVVKGDRFGSSIATLVEGGNDEEERLVTLVVGAERESRLTLQGGGVHILAMPPSYVEVCSGAGETCTNSGDEGGGYTCG